MSDNFETTTLLKALQYNWFKSSRSKITYVFEQEVDGKTIVKLPDNDDVLTFWKLIFCDAIIGLTTAPGSTALSKDVLSAFVRKKVDSKNSRVLNEKIIPNLSDEGCFECIDEEIEHLKNKIYLGVRVAESMPRNKNITKLNVNELKGEKEVKYAYRQALGYLITLFFKTPFEVIKKEYPWFEQYVKNIFNLDYTKSDRHIYAVFACALILSLNITDESEISNNIEKYIINAKCDDEEDEDNEGTATEKKNDSNEGIITLDKRELGLVIKFAALKIRFYDNVIKDEDLEIAIRNIIDLIEASLFDDFLSISGQLWKDYSIEQKAQAIFSVYKYEKQSVEEEVLGHTKGFIDP